jgi:uncharacterized small protein (TIGR04563 family)
VSDRFPAEKRKVTIYFTEKVILEMTLEARRLDRPISWLVFRAWKIAYARMLEERASEEAQAPDREPA